MGETQEKPAETPEVKTEGEKQPESTEWTPPTKEEFEATQQELEKAKSQANTFQGLLKEAQRKTITKEDLSNIYTRIDDQQRWIGTALDDFKKGFGNDYGEEKVLKSYTEDAETHIKKANESRETPTDPEALKFFDYLAGEELVFEEVEGNFVYDTIKDCKTPQEALKSVRAAVKERDMNKLRGDLKKEAEADRDRIREEVLKEYGLSTTGVTNPSASSKDLSSMTPDEKLQEGFKELTKKK